MPTLTYANLGKPVIAWTPQDLFIYGNDGFWPDGESPADGRLFQDVAATLPATTFAQPIGLAQRLSGTANLQQATAAARPGTAREPKGGRRNLLEGPSENFSGCAFNNLGIVDNTDQAPDGSLTATRVKATLTAGGTIVRMYRTATIVSRIFPAPFTRSIYVKPTPTSLRYIFLFSDGGPNVYFDTQTNTIAAATGAVGAYGVEPAPNGFYRIWYVSTAATGGGNNHFTGMTDRLTGSLLNATVGTEEILVWGEQIEYGSIVTPYQKVTTIYGVTEAGVPDVWSLRTDGVDDLMASTATFDVNKPWYFAVCATIESDGGVTSHQTPFFGLNAVGNVVRNMIGVRSAGGIRVCALHRNGGANPIWVTDVITGVSFGQPFIVEGWADGTNLHCSLNGGPKVSAPYTPGSSPNLAPIQLAAGGGIAPTRYYDALAIQRIPSDAERAALRARWAARYLP